MPWKECKPMDERLRFIARLLEGEQMAPLCREFGISRVTGYKIFSRYKECGLDALNDRSRAPYRQSKRLPYVVERSILGIKQEHPSWGAPKIRDKLARSTRWSRPQPSVACMPCSTVLAGVALARRSFCRELAVTGCWVTFVLKAELKTRQDKPRRNVRLVECGIEAIFILESMNQVLLYFGVVPKQIEVVGKGVVRHDQSCGWRLKYLSRLVMHLLKPAQAVIPLKNGMPIL